MIILRKIIAIFSALICFSIAISRMYIGVHSLD
jgi:membrane-associated phospholipid phosphatase